MQQTEKRNGLWDLEFSEGIVFQGICTENESVASRCFSSSVQIKLVQSQHVNNLLIIKHVNCPADHFVCGYCSGTASPVHPRNRSFYA